jgi:hypothetical protein
VYPSFPWIEIEKFDKYSKPINQISYLHGTSNGDYVLLGGSYCSSEIVCIKQGLFSLYPTKLIPYIAPVHDFDIGDPFDLTSNSTGVLFMGYGLSPIGSIVQIHEFLNLKSISSSKDFKGAHGIWSFPVTTRTKTAHVLCASFHTTTKLFHLLGI